ncbi:MAG TPA: glycosyltransferase family 2 protein [Verrucomicrobiae bacterium]|nr:glycosyltransferase family 2 protein [Verrucomicrobiae bacterium]
MTVSVAMATCNGLPYLKEQLDSIRQQTLAADEIVVCDDASTDGTWEYVIDVARCDARVRVHRNEIRVGSTANFARAIEFCRGDVIFLSDQDDVWAPNKVARMTAVLKAEGAALVMSNGILVAADGTDQGRSLWQANGIDTKVALELQSRRAGALLAARVYVTGSATCFVTSLVHDVLPIPEHAWHDRWLALIASLARPGAIRLLDEPLYRYRQHAGNQIGAGGYGWWRRVGVEVASTADIEADIECLAAARLRLEELVARYPDAGAVAKQYSLDRLLSGRLQHQRRRMQYVAREMPMWSAFLRYPEYRAFSRGGRTLLRDMLTRLYQRL